MKRKLKICVDLPGSINHGLWSPERGESRWAQNLAWGLAEHGHEVTAFSYMYGPPSWGVCPKIPNINLVHWQSIPKDYEFDVLVDNCYWPGKPVIAKARLMVIGRYGKPSAEEIFPTNSIIATPYKTDWVDEEKFFWLPAPYFRILKQSNFSKQRIILPSRDVTYKEEPAKNAEMLLQILFQFSNQYKISSHIFLVASYNGQVFVGNPDQPEEQIRRLKQYHLLELARKLPSPRFLPVIPWGEVLGYFAETKLNIPLFNPSNVIDAAMSGVASIVFNESVFDWLKPICDQKEFNIKYGDPPEKITSIIEPIYRDEKTYNRLLGMQQEAIKDLEWKSSLEKWEQVVYQRL